MQLSPTTTNLVHFGSTLKRGIGESTAAAKFAKSQRTIIPLHSGQIHADSMVVGVVTPIAGASIICPISMMIALGEPGALLLGVHGKGAVIFLDRTVVPNSAGVGI